MRITKIEIEEAGYLEKLQADIKSDLVFVIDPTEKSFCYDNFLVEMYVFDYEAGIRTPELWNAENYDENYRLYIEMEDKGDTYAILRENTAGSPSLDGQDILFNGALIPKNDYLRYVFAGYMVPYSYARLPIFLGGNEANFLKELRNFCANLIKKNKRRYKDKVSSDPYSRYYNSVLDTIAACAKKLRLPIDRNKDIWLGLKRTGEFKLMDGRRRLIDIELNRQERAIYGFLAFLTYHNVVADIARINNEPFDLPLFVSGNSLFGELNDDYDTTDLFKVIKKSGKQIFFALSGTSPWNEKILSASFKKQFVYLVPCAEEE